MDFQTFYNKAYLIEKWRALWAIGLGLSMTAGGAVEWWSDKNHSYFWAVAQFAMIGFLASQVVIFRKRVLVFSTLGFSSSKIPMWTAGLMALFLACWLGDYRHGFLISHQYGNFVAAIIGGGTGIFALYTARFKAPVLTNKPLSAPKLAVLLKKENRHQVRRPVEDLPALVRNLVLAMNAGHRIRVREQIFIKEHLLLAVEGLIASGRHDKAAQLLKKVPRSRVSFRDALDGLAPDEGLKVAAAAYRRDDWGTALIILDHLFTSSADPQVHDHVLSTGILIAEQVSQLDETFEAKVIVLRLDSSFAGRLKSVARMSSAV